MNALLVGTGEDKKQAILYLCKLFSGWVAGFGISVLILGNIFDSHIYQLSSLFLGLTLFAIPVVVMEERESLAASFRYLIFTVFGVGIASAITYFNQMVGGSNTVDIGHFSLSTVIYVFIVAMIAISAMVLPGISGSSLLLIFGLYVPVIHGLKEFLHFNFSYLPMLIVFGLGIIAGIFAVIRLVKTALEKYRSQMIYFILGLMLGSLYAIAMGPTTLDTPQPALTGADFHIVYFLAGGALIAGLEALKKNMGEGERSDQ